MYKNLILGLVLVASAAWLQAQAGYPQSEASQTPGTTSTQNTVQGCLQESGGNYTLAADDGTMYQLSGNTSKLSAHVGHEVQITGRASSSSAASSPSGTGQGASQEATLNVKSMKHLSETCKSSPK